MTSVVRTEKRQRSAFGQLIKWVFIAFNVFMLVWLISGMGAVSNMQPTSEAARVGHAIGATIGFSMILGIWMMGDVILGLFVLLTRGDKVIVEETSVGRSLGSEPTASTMDADAAIARYMQRQQTAAQSRVPSAPASTGGFGRRSSIT